MTRAGEWLVTSGIQEESGGVARYYRSDSRQSAPVSTEITGYAVSALVYLYEITGARRYLEAAERAARFLVERAWSEHSATFPFEPVLNGGPAFAYFFDCGIIARGLLAAWRITGNSSYFERAKQCGLSMAFDFIAEEAMHPVLTLPEKHPAPYERKWSRRPGCYQLKSAVAWRELAAATGQHQLSAAFDRMLSYSLSTQARFLPGDSDDHKVMDRLHSFAYFLEGLLLADPDAEGRSVIADGIERIAAYLERIAPAFARCDVYAQLLRLRLFAAHAGISGLNEHAAGNEAQAIAEFEAETSDPRIAGGFWFGRKQGRMMPFVNPVSTIFAMQALRLWREHRQGATSTPVLALI